MKTYLTLNDIFGEKSVDERMLDLANRLKNYRKKLKLTQLELADRSGVSYGSIKLFERTGKISLESLWLICITLECDDELDSLFTHPKITAEDIREGRL